MNYILLSDIFCAIDIIAVFLLLVAQRNRPALLDWAYRVNQWGFLVAVLTLMFLPVNPTFQGGFLMVMITENTVIDLIRSQKAKTKSTEASA